MMTQVKTEKEIFKTVEIAEEVWTEHYTPIIGSGQVEYMLKKFQSAEAIHNQVSEGYEYFLIDGTKGYFSILPEENCLFLSKLYVLKKFRGQGYGRSAFEFIFNKAAGKEKIRLTVNKQNYDSIEVYKALGFIICDEVKADIGSGYFMDDYTMEKYL